MGRAIWRDLVIGFAAQLGELNLGFTQLAALYALADSGTMTVADLADTLGRSQSAASRIVDAPLSASQTTAVLSLQPETMRLPSGLKATLVMLSVFSRTKIS